MTFTHPRYLRCSWCSLSIFSPEPPRCKKCNAIICDPILRDCGLEHWRAQHLPRPARKIEDVRPL